MLYAIVALLVIVLDQWTKLWVTTNIPAIASPGEVDFFNLIPGVISLDNIQNKGAAFGFLADRNASIIFIAIAGAVALLTIIALATNLVKGQLGRWSLVFIAAGGLSNAIDRLMSDGSVQDMIKLDFLEKMNINFPIFNVADVFITVFCILFILYVLFGGRKKDRDDDYDDDEYEDDEEYEEDEEEDERPKRRWGRKTRRVEEDEYEDDEEEEEEDDEYEDERPKRRWGRKARRVEEDEYEDDEEEEEEDERPLRRAEKPRHEEPAKSHRSAQSSYAEDYEQYKAKKAREAAEAAPAPQEAAPVIDPDNPFAEWDRAKEKAEAEKAAAMAAAVPQAEPAPAPAPAPAPQPAPATEEFSLEDILAEFR